jgi:hypothetical protein
MGPPAGVVPCLVRSARPVLVLFFCFWGIGTAGRKIPVDSARRLLYRIGISTGLV